MKDNFVQIDVEIKNNRIRGFSYIPNGISPQDMLLILESLCKGLKDKMITEDLLNKANEILDL